MKLPDWTIPQSAVVLAVLTVASGAAAQEVVAPSPTGKLTAPMLRDAAPVSQSSPAEPTGAFFQFGPVSLHPHLMVRSIYGLGLPAEGGRHVASMIYTTAPGLQVDFGQHWTLDYSPAWLNYSARALKDTVDHSARLQGAWMVQDWAVQFSENYSKSSPLLIETGTQTAQRAWATQLGASRRFGTRFNFSTQASLDERYGDTAPDTRDWSTMNWLTVSLSSRMQAGLGLGAGYSDIVAQPDATFERYMGRINWSPTHKLILAVDGGVEMRHSRSSAAKDMHNPIVNASLVYQPFATTTLTLANTRTVTNSYFQKQVTKAVNSSISLSQRLLERFYLSASYNRQHSDFEYVTTEVPVITQPDPLADPVISTVLVSLPGRSDRTAALNLRLTTTLFKQWTVAASYSRSKNSSSQAGFTFTTTQFGLEVGCRF